MFISVTALADRQVEQLAEGDDSSAAAVMRFQVPHGGQFGMDALLGKPQRVGTADGL